MDIALREWAQEELPQQALAAGRNALASELRHLMENASHASDADTLYDQLKNYAVERALERHQWEERAQDVSVLHISEAFFFKK